MQFIKPVFLLAKLFAVPACSRRIFFANKSRCRIHFLTNHVAELTFSLRVEIRPVENFTLQRQIATLYIPRLSSLHPSLVEDTLVNACHVASRFWEPACERS